MWCRRSSTRTFSPSSSAQRSAMVRPKKPEPTTTRSGVDTVGQSTSHAADCLIPATARMARITSQVALGTPLRVLFVREWWSSSSWLRYFGWAWVAGILMLVATIWIAGTENLPVRDPDAFIPGYFRMPLIVLAAILTDIVPRAVRRSGGRVRNLPAAWSEVATERWPRSHWVF